VEDGPAVASVWPLVLDALLLVDIAFPLHEVLAATADGGAFDAEALPPPHPAFGAGAYNGRPRALGTALCLSLAHDPRSAARSALRLAVSSHPRFQAQAPPASPLYQVQGKTFRLFRLFRLCLQAGCQARQARGRKNHDPAFVGGLRLGFLLVASPAWRPPCAEVGSSFHPVARHTQPGLRQLPW